MVVYLQAMRCCRVRFGIVVCSSCTTLVSIGGHQFVNWFWLWYSLVAPALRLPRPPLPSREKAPRSVGILLRRILGGSTYLTYLYLPSWQERPWTLLPHLQCRPEVRFSAPIGRGRSDLRLFLPDFHFHPLTSRPPRSHLHSKLGASHQRLVHCCTSSEIPSAEADNSPERVLPF